MLQSQIKQFQPLLKALLTPLVFELCGIIPLILVSLGLIGVSAGVALRNALVYQYSYIFYILAAVFFGYSIYLYLKTNNSCNISGLKRNQKLIIFVFGVLTILEGILLFALQLVEKLIYGQSQTNIKDLLGVLISWWGIFALFLLLLRLREKILTK